MRITLLGAWGFSWHHCIWGISEHHLAEAKSQHLPLFSQAVVIRTRFRCSFRLSIPKWFGAKSVRRFSRGIGSSRDYFQLAKRLPGTRDFPFPNEGCLSPPWIPCPTALSEMKLFNPQKGHCHWETPDSGIKCHFQVRCTYTRLENRWAQ